MSLIAQPEEIEPPEFVVPMVVRAPWPVRESKEDAEGSNETVVALLNRLRPANAPARPTWPMRLKSTMGNDANAGWARRAARKNVEGHSVEVDGCESILDIEMSTHKYVPEY